MGYGGDLAARTRFAVEVIREVRNQVSPIFLSASAFSQWKLQDYSVRLAQSPAEFGELPCASGRRWEWICSLLPASFLGSRV